ncbi:MAG: hypothetical protein CR972_04000 [Candidatus Moraniibacteriota bacterium]|nr:MAG: hypothetical protein CR972_04000 [Candidatus Moranbacteria bacterium]
MLQNKRMDVKGGRIRTTCPWCRMVKYSGISASVHRKNVRCKCGKSTMYKINHRKHKREICTIPATVCVDGRIVRVWICDRSPFNIGFTVPRGDMGKFRKKQRVEIKYKESTRILGKQVIIQSKFGDRIGATIINPIICQ